MTIQVIGILRNPMGQPIPNTEIRVASVIGSTNVLAKSVAIHFTDASGNYDYPLEDGQYIIDVLYNDTYEIAGSSIVNAGTPTPVNMSELFLYTTPLNPQQVVDLQAEFDLKIANLTTAFDTETQEIRTQLVDGDTTVLQTAQTFTNDRLGLQLAVITAEVASGDASVLAQSTAYSDASGAVLAADITSVTAAEAATSLALTSFTDAQGLENSSIRSEVVTSQATAISTSNAYSDAATGVSSATLTGLITAGDATVLQQAGVNSDAYTDATEAFLLDQLTVTNDSITASYESYVIASLGFFDVPSGLWVDGPLSASFRAHTIQTGGGNYASITDTMETFEMVGGNLVAKGSVISDVNGRVSGYRTSNDGTSSTFEIIADDFKIGHMSTDPTPVFVVGMQFNTLTKLLEVKGDIVLSRTLAADKIIANSITAAEIFAKTITASEIAADTITANEILVDTITGNEISATTSIIAGSTDISTVQLTVGQNIQFSNTYLGFIGVGQGTLNAVGSISFLQEIRGEVIKSLYSVISDDTLTQETWLWLVNQPASLTDITLNINGNIVVFTHFSGGAFKIVGTTAFDTLNGLTVPIDGEELELTNASTAIAGMNGDDTGTNVSNRYKGIRFWAGLEFPRDPSGNEVAPFLVRDDGSMYAQEGVFEGTVRADRIDSDVIAGKLFMVAANQISLSNGATQSVSLYSGNVGSSASTGDRVLYFPDFMFSNGHFAPAVGSNSWCRTRAVVDGNTYIGGEAGAFTGSVASAGGVSGLAVNVSAGAHTYEYFIDFFCGVSPANINTTWGTTTMVQQLFREGSSLT